MREPSKTNQELIEENATLKLRIQKLEKSEPERKRAEEALKESEEFIKVLFHGSMIPKIIMDAETGIYIDCNETAVKIYGYSSREEVIGKTPIDVSAPTQYDGSESLTEAGKRIQACRRDGSHVFEWRHQRPNGQIWDGAVHLMLFMYKGKLLMKFTLQDISERKKAEVALRESAERYRLLAEKANDVIYRMKIPEGTYEYVSPSAKRVLGYDQEELYENPMLIREAIHPDWQEYMEDQWQAILNGQEPEEFEFAILDKQGKTRWHSQRNSYLKDVTGKVTALQGIVRDITKQRQLEEDIKTSEKKYRDFFNEVPIGMFQSSREGRFLSVNNHLAIILGYDSPEDLIESITDIGTQIYAAPEKRDEVMHLLRNKGFFENYEVQCRHKDGHYIWGELSTRAVRDTSGSILYFEGSSKDVTARKEAEKRLQESEKKYRVIVENTNDAIYIHDFEGNIIDVNDNACQMVGYERNELIGTNLARIDAEWRVPDRSDIPDENLTEDDDKWHLPLNEDLERLLREGHAVFERVNIRKDGVKVPVEVSVRIFSLEGKSVSMGFVRDISERKQTEERLKQSERKFATAFLKNSIPAAITSVKEGRYIEVSEAFLTLMGLERSEVVGNTSTGIGFITPEQRQIVLNEFMQKGYVENLELQMRTKEGEHRYGLFNSVLISFSGEDHLLTMVTDITSRKRSEEKMQNLLIFLQTLFNTIPSPIFCKDINGIYLDCNKEFENYTGKEKQEIIGKDVYSIYPYDIADKYHEKDLALFRHPGRQVYEAQLIYADGNKHDVVVNKATYFNVDDTLAGLVGVMVDITKRKQAEKELVIHQERLEQLVKERTRDLERKTKALEEVNTASKVLLQYREEDKKELEHRFVMNIKRLILPFVGKMKNTPLDEGQLAYLSIIETNLTDITSSLIKKLHQFNFTPTELEIAFLIKEGKATKDISRIMGIAASSVNTHRNKIRKKLGISMKDVNLCSHLQSFD